MKIFSYVVDHDNGFSPNPYYGVCTLAHCKFGKKGKKNVVELAQKGDWVVGTGGNGKRSAGHGKLIYAMRVDEKLTLKQYYHDRRFRKKKPRENGSYQQAYGDNLSKSKHRTNRFVLISHKYFYFGDKAIGIPQRFRNHPAHPLEKKGPGFRSKFSETFTTAVTEWLDGNFRSGIHGIPHGYAFSKSENTASKICR
jgi:hypothetical protein